MYEINEKMNKEIYMGHMKTKWFEQPANSYHNPEKPTNYLPKYRIMEKLGEIQFHQKRPKWTSSL